MMKNKLKTEFWGEVDVDEETYGALLELYKIHGIAAIVKIAAHIGFEQNDAITALELKMGINQSADPTSIDGYGDLTQGDPKSAKELFRNLCTLVRDAEQYDSDSGERYD
jgi:hypothetical protein